MNGFELNKIAAAILVGGIIAMLSGFGAEILYDIHEQPEKRGYQVEGIADTPTASTTGKFEWPSFEIGKLMAAANSEKGQQIFKKCAVCHSNEKNGTNKVGPGLWNSVDHDKASHEGYSYSEALKAKEGKWTYEDLFKFLYSPKDFAKGTKMGFAGLKKPEELADVIAYLRTLHDNPPALPPADLVSSKE
ncbi:MAG: cytochrome c family protein [Sphingobacteriia bacterium]|nr:cytochrome c family protein [Sphingobacteriia bacterium]